VRTHASDRVVVTGSDGVDKLLGASVVCAQRRAADASHRRLGRARRQPTREVAPVAIAVLERNQTLRIGELKTRLLTNTLASFGLIAPVRTHQVASATAIPVEIQALREFVMHDGLRGADAR
jgi:hypothetical protein